MDWSAIWQGILSNGLYALLIFAGGVMLAILRKKGSRWFSPILWGLIGCGLVAVIVIAFVVLNRIPQPPPKITSENLEANIRTWLDTFGQGTQKIEDSSMVFAYGVTATNGTHLLIARPKSLDRYIILQSAIAFDSPDKAILEKMSKEQREQFIEELSVELSRMKIGYTFDNPLTNITLIRRIPITDSLTEDAFMEKFDEIDYAKLLTLATIRLKLHGTEKKD